MLDFELETKIVDIYENAGFPIDRMDVGITLMKMTDVQTQDLLAMIAFFIAHKKPATYIAGNIGHDLNGLKDEFINGSCGFSPRSSGYFRRVNI